MNFILNGPVEMLHKTNSAIFISPPGDMHISRTLQGGLLTSKEGLKRKETLSSPPLSLPSYVLIASRRKWLANTGK